MGGQTGSTGRRRRLALMDFPDKPERLLLDHGAGSVDETLPKLDTQVEPSLYPWKRLAPLQGRTCSRGRACSTTGTG